MKACCTTRLVAPSALRRRSTKTGVAVRRAQNRRGRNHQHRLSPAARPPPHAQTCRRAAADPRFQTSRATRTLRVAASRSGLMAVISPSKWLVGIGVALTASTFRPVCNCDKLLLRQGKIHEHRRQRLQRNDALAHIQLFAQIHQPDAQPAGERRADGFLFEWSRGCCPRWPAACFQRRVRLVHFGLRNGLVRAAIFAAARRSASPVPPAPRRRAIAPLRRRCPAAPAGRPA